MQGFGTAQRSREVGERTVQADVRTLGVWHPNTLSVAANYAVTLRQLGDVDAALRFSADSLAGIARALGSDHPLALACAMNLASDHFEMQDFKQALSQDAATLERLTRVLGPDHPRTHACALNLALDHHATGRTRRGTRSSLTQCGSSSSSSAVNIPQPSRQAEEFALTPTSSPCPCKPITSLRLAATALS
jgi:hypothetical protein